MSGFGITGRRVGPVERLFEDMLWTYSRYLFECRQQGETWQQIAEREGIHRKTARRYAIVWECRLRYESGNVLAQSCNAVGLTCACGKTFTATRADARYCSNACRQDAYRARKKVGA